MRTREGWTDAHNTRGFFFFHQIKLKCMSSDSQRWEDIIIQTRLGLSYNTNQGRRHYYITEDQLREHCVVAVSMAQHVPIQTVEQKSEDCIKNVLIFRFSWIIPFAASLSAHKFSSRHICLINNDDLSWALVKYL